MKFKDKMVKEAIMMQLQGKIVEEGDKDSKMGFMYEVDGEIVRLFKKAGRRNIICTCCDKPLFEPKNPDDIKYCTCTCTNGTRYCNEPTICKHKIAALMEYMRLVNK